MNSEAADLSKTLDGGGLAAATRESLRVAVICDFKEEQWPSMDLVADMLCHHLAENCHDKVAVTKIRPAASRRLSRFPLLPEKLAWNADRLVNRFVDYPVRLRHQRFDYDLFHLVDHSYAQLVKALPPGRTVVTCHDLDSFRCLLQPEHEPRPRWFRAMARRILDGLREAAHVIAVSEATRDELLRYDLIPQHRISVVANGVHPSCSPLPDPPADEAVSRLLPNCGSEALWLLNVSSTLPRKRLDVLLRIFAAVRKEFPGARLLRVGGGFTPAQLELARDLNVEKHIVILPYLERDVLAAVYRRAALLLHTAEAEGFGLPLIEAMACGCQVVATRVPVLREIGGSAAEYCALDDMDSWKETIVDLLRARMRQDKIWNFRRQAGLTHAARFSWAENARQTAKIYQQVLGSA
jgi:glycosyltransferase involved in cell wall biosynthesis